MPFSANKPLPQIALELLCGALEEAIQQRYVAGGLPLNRLAEFTCLRERWGLLPHQQLSLELEDRLAYFATVAGNYEMAARLADKAGIGIEDLTIDALVQRLAVPLSRFTA
jgi:hypothetical protein